MTEPTEPTEPLKPGWCGCPPEDGPCQIHTPADSAPVEGLTDDELTKLADPDRLQSIENFLGVMGAGLSQENMEKVKQLATMLEPNTLAVFALVDVENPTNPEDMNLALVGAANFPPEMMDCFELLKLVVNQRPEFEHMTVTDA